ncbi:origin recognition complex subunit 2 isoform X1 [Anas acuta]|uniref:origin recognition complex subunit 2 isoform X1 n=1 Tax=Anas acuta TaxID=28680 RepID=UPI0035C89DD1
MSQAERKGGAALEVKFVPDEAVLRHIADDAGIKVRKDKTPLTVNVKRFVKKLDTLSDDEAQEFLEEKDYVAALGICAQDLMENGSSVGGSEVYSFQTPKRSNKMAELASELAQTPGQSVASDHSECPEKKTKTPQSSKHSSSNKVQQKSKKNDFISTTPYRLRKRLAAPDACLESESEYSASCSEEEDDEESQKEVSTVLSSLKTPAKAKVASTPPSRKKVTKKKDKMSNLVEEYFEAHSTSKVLTSDRTLQKLRKRRLNQQTLHDLLEKSPLAYAAEIEELNQQYESLFSKWMLQLHLGFNIVLYGLGSKHNLLEKFRISMLQDTVHLVVNGYFPSITVRSILTSITEEVLDHIGTFRSPLDQLEFIIKRFKEDSSLELYVLIHNLDSQMLRGERSQQILAQLSSLPSVYLIASIDHINAPLMWDQAKQSLYNWLWYETTTFSPYMEETSYENSLLVQQSGSLALSSLTHVLRSLTLNARGIFRLLAQYQLENKDNPSYPGLSFQDFYQQCREAFLVNSDLTLRAQLTEFRDHKLIRTKRECPLILEEALNATYKLSILVALRGWENAEVLQLFFIVFLRYVGVSPIVSSTVVCQTDFRDSLCLILGSCVTAQCCNSTYQPNKVLYYFSLVCLVFHKCFYVIGR